MKTKVIKRFHDMKERKIQEVGTVLEVNEARMKWLISQGMVEEYQGSEEEPAGQEPKETKGTAKTKKGES